MPRSASTYWRAVFCCTLFVISADMFAATFTSVQNGDWNSNITWGTAPGPNSTPVAGDTVNIGTGTNSYIVTINNPGAAAAIINIGNSNSASELRINSGLTVSNTVNVSLYSRIFNQGFQPVSIGSLTGAGSAEGTLTINGGTFSGSLQGSITFQTGTFTLVPSTFFGFTSSGQFTIPSGTLKLTSGSTNFDGLLSDSTSIVLTGGTFDLNGANEAVGSVEGTGAITLGSGTLTVKNFSEKVHTGAITGTGGITKENGGKFYMLGSNSYSGATTVNSGILAIGSASIPNSSSVRLYGGNIEGATNNPLNPIAPPPFSPGATATFGSLEGSGNIFLPGSLTVGGNNSSTQFDGQINLSAPMPSTPLFQKSGTGTFSLGGSFSNSIMFSSGDPTTYLVTVTAGTLRLASANRIDDLAKVSISSGATFNMNGFQETVGGLVGAGTLQFGDNFAQQLTINQTGNSTFSGIMTTNGFFPPGILPANVYKTGDGILTLSGTANCHFQIQSGAIKLGASQVINDYATIFIGGGSNPVFDLANFSETIQTLMGTGKVSLGTATLTVGPSQNVSGSNSTFDGVIEGTGGLTKQGDSVLTLRGQNTYTGATTINGGDLEIQSSGMLSDSSAVSVASGATLRTYGLAEIGSLSGSGEVFGYIKLGKSNTSTTFSGFQFGGDLVKTGTGTFTVSGFISGRVDIEGGTLKLGQLSVIDDFVPVRVGSSGTFDLNGNKETIAWLEGAGTVALGTATLTIGCTGPSFNTPAVFSGVISGTGGITKEGGSEFYMLGSNTYSGATTVNSGTLYIGSASIPSSSPVRLYGGSIAGATNDPLNPPPPATPPFAPGSTATFGSLEGNGSINIPGSLTVGGNNSSTQFDGQINLFASGGFPPAAVSFQKSGTGTFTLGGFSGDSISFSGGDPTTYVITVSAGTMRLNASDKIDDEAKVAISAGATFNLNGYGETLGGLSGSGTLQFGDNFAQTLNINQTGDSTFSGIMTTNGFFPPGILPANVIKTGNGTLTLSGTANCNFQIQSGALKLGASQVINDYATISIGGGFNPVFDLANFSETIQTLMGTGKVALGSGTLTVGPSQGVFGSSSNYNGIIEGTGGLTKQGDSVLSLGGVNTYTGATTINGGVLEILNFGALSDSSAVSVALGAMLRTYGQPEIGSLSGSGDVNGYIKLGKINTSTTFSGFQFGGDLVKTGTGTFTVSGFISGRVDIEGGTLKLGQLSVIDDFVPVRVGSSGTFDLNGNRETIASLEGAGSVALGTATLTIAGNGQSPFSFPNPAVFSGAISGTGGVTVGPSGTLELSGSNTYTGTTQVDGQLKLGESDVIANTSPVVMQGGSITSTDPNNDQVETIGSLSGFGSVTIKDTLTTGGNDASTNFGGTLDCNLIKRGTGTMTLSGMVQKSFGQLVVSIIAGSIRLNVNELLDNSATVAVSAGASLDLNSYSETVSSVTGAGTVSFGTVGGNSLRVGGDNQDTSFSGSMFSGSTIPGVSYLVKEGTGALTLSGSVNTTVQISAGKIVLGNPAVINDQVGVELQGSGTIFDLNGKNEAILYLTGNGEAKLGAATLSVGPSQGSGDVDRIFSGTISGTGGLTKVGFNRFELSGSNTYTGATTISGGTLAVSSTTGLSNQTAVAVASGSTLQNLTTLQVGSISGAGDILSFSGTLTAGGDNSSTVFSGIFGGAAANGFTKAGTGTLTLSGIFDSGISIDAGTVKLGGDNVISDNASVVINNNPQPPKFDLNNNNETIGSLSGSGLVTLGSGTLTIVDNGAGGSPTYSGIISGTGDLVLMRALTLTGANTYTGTTNVQVGGTLTLGASNVIRDTSPLVVEGSLVSASNPAMTETVGSLQGSGTVNYAGTLTFGGLNTSTTFLGPVMAGGLVKAGLGAISFFDDLNTISINITAGTVTLELPNLINDSASVNISSGARLDLNNNDETFAALSGAGNLLFGNSIPNSLVVGNGSNTIFSGSISGVDTTDALVKVGLGTLTLSGTNTYVGATTVAAGTLTVLGPFPSAITVNASATLAGTSTIGAVADNGIIDPGTGAGTGTITVNGNANLTTGTLFVNIPDQNSGDRVTANGNLTLDGTSTLVLDLGGFAGAMPNSVFTIASAGGTLSGVFTTESILNNSSGKPVFVSYHVPGQVRVAVGNNAPVIDLNGSGATLNHSTGYTEGSAPRPIVVVDSLTVSDAETGTVDSVDVTITNLLNPGNEILAAVPTGNISVSYNSTTGVLSLTGVDTIARYQTVLRTVTYQNTSANPDISAARIIEFIARDERDTSIVSAPSTSTVTITPVNTPPFVDLNGSGSGADFSTIFTEDGGPVAIVSSSAFISDPDSATINSATVTLTDIQDAGLETLTVTTNGNIVASFDSQTGVLTLTGADTLTAYGSVLKSITYLNTSQNPTGDSRTITVSVKEGASPSNDAIANIAIRSVNDIPAFTKGADQTVAEDAGAQTVTGWATGISSGPAAESSQILTFNLSSNNPALFAVAPAVNAAGDLTYTPADDVNGTATVTVTLSDDGGTSFGGVDTTAAQTFTITVTAVAENFIVTNVNDSGAGSLRDRMERARSGDTITFDENVFDLTNADAATIINVSQELPTLDDGNVTIDAQDRRVTINGSGAGSASGLVITSSNNLVRGLSIVGFTKSGVFINAGATNNLIGGNRNQGTGPNGQGLRVGNCGAFAIEISGAGTDQNTVKGCWLGLDASGVSAQPNLAGILIQGGAKGNIIGGTADGESNVLSGNTFEGVTISGAGTDDNIIIGNIVGSSAVETASASRSRASSRELIIGRAAVGNGTAGVFLSKGTKGSQVGGEGNGDGNGIANNGGNGIEVRAQLTRKNSARANGISKNRRGGIALFDGSNDGITPPTFASVVASQRAAGAASRSDLDAVILGRASINSGKVEVFADPEDQGSRLVGRAIVVNGEWQVIGTVTDTENITATFTDDNGNTSAFAFFGRAPAQGSGGVTDTDGDGVSDTLEVLAGTDPLNATDAPAMQGAVTAAKFSAGLNFTTTNKDSLKASLQITLPAGFTVAASSASVQFDAVSRSVVLNDKGKSPNGNVAMKLSTKAGAPSSILTVSMKSQDLRAGLTPSGLTDKTTAKTGEVLSVPIAVVMTSGAGGKSAYVGSVNVVYKAIQAKRGKAGKQ